MMFATTQLRRAFDATSAAVDDLASGPKVPTAPTGRDAVLKVASQGKLFQKEMAQVDRILDMLKEEEEGGL